MPEVQPTADAMQGELEKQEQKVEAPVQSPLTTEKKRGPGRPRKDGATVAPKSTLGFKTQANDSQNQTPQNLSPEIASSLIVDGIEMTGFIIAREQAKMFDAEKLAMKGGIKYYLEKTGQGDLPPSLVLGMSIAPYYIRVLNEKVGEEKLSTFERIAIFFMRFKKKKAEAKK